MQTIKESYSQKPILLNRDIQEKLMMIKGNVTQFALESIKLELLALMESEDVTGHESHVSEGQLCLCKWRRNYRLPCRHLLAEYYKKAGPIPLNVIHQRWRITYAKGKGML